MTINRKGVVLVTILVLILVAMIAGFALYQAVGIFCKMQIDDTKQIKADYVAAGGIIYAQMLLKNPTAAPLNFAKLAPSTTSPVSATVHVSQASNKPLADSLGITGSQDLAVTILEHSADDKYDAISVFTY